MIMIVKNEDDTARVTLAATEEELLLSDGAHRLGGEAPETATVQVGDIGINEFSPFPILEIWADGAPFSGRLPTGPVLAVRFALVEFAATMVGRRGLLFPGVRAILDLDPPDRRREDWTNPLQFTIREARPSSLIISRWRRGE